MSEGRFWGLFYSVPIVLLLQLGWVLPASAQTAIACPQSTQTVIAYGQRLIGCSLTAVGTRTTYSFDGAQGDLARFSLKKQGGQGSPCLEIYDPFGILFGGQSCRPSNFTLSLPHDGRY